MIFSNELLFSDDQVVTTTGESTNIIDLGAPGTVLHGPTALTRDIGPGRPIPVRIQLTADAANADNTLDVVLQVSTDEAFSAPITVATAPQIAPGSAGSQAMINYVPKGTDERYLRLNYTVAGTTPSYTITAGIVMGDQSNEVAGVAGV